MKGHGRLFDPIMIGKSVYVDLKDCGNVAFICYLAAAAGDTYTLTEAKDASGTGAKVLAVMTEYYTGNGVGGAWTKQTQAAASTVVTTATTAQNGMVVEVDPKSLDAGYSFLKLVSTGSGLITILRTDLNVERRPSSLASSIV